MSEREALINALDNFIGDAGEEDALLSAMDAYVDHRIKLLAKPCEPAPTPASPVPNTRTRECPSS